MAAEHESSEALESQNLKTNEEEEEEEEGEEEEDCDDEAGVGEFQRGEFRSSDPKSGAEPKELQLETLAAPDSGLQVNSTSKSNDGAQTQGQTAINHEEVLTDTRVQNPDAPRENQHQSTACQTSPELSPTSVTQSISSAPSPTFLEQRLSPPKDNGLCKPEADQQNSSDIITVSPVPSMKNLKIPASDGYNWRKYGQKQVKSPKGSRSYYKCTYSECCAKKIECCDHSGHVTEIVYKSEHTHDPPKRSNSTKENKLPSVERFSGSTVTKQPSKVPRDSDPSASAKESIHETTPCSERKRQSLMNSDENGDVKVKEEHNNEPEPKKRLKKNQLEYSGSLLKPSKKPKFVVHAAGDVGISADGHRWRKYGQKMVKGNPHPRNYYRCTSAGCPVRKHIESAVDNSNAVIITYKGVHDHDMPVPKKRHGPPSAPLVAAAAPASMNNLQSKKSETTQNQITSTQWSVDNEGELTGEALDLGGEKAMESARTLLSIGFEIKPC
ncbi:WRKY domain containing protein [Trema orientale]|uniref:WRKY domain containing protein n=1 Tax=Trema orientale TaxID=63057 RepID=A0A2P5FNQ3_TREOI|nr:WRKY domain containing protein [Trema orientale]